MAGIGTATSPVVRNTAGEAGGRQCVNMLRHIGETHTDARH